MSGRWLARFAETGFAAMLAILAVASGAQADVVDALRSCGLTAGETGVVSKVIDGDTLILKTDPQKTPTENGRASVRKEYTSSGLVFTRNISLSPDVE